MRGLEVRLEKLDAIDNINVDRWEEGFVIVRLKPGENVEDGVLLKGVKESGFVLREIRRGEPAGPKSGAGVRSEVVAKSATAAGFALRQVWRPMVAAVQGS